jgi:hypothetical protein
MALGVIQAMPTLKATVHEDVAAGIKHIAAERGVSIRTVTREALYEYVARQLGMELDAPVTTYTRT